MTNLGNYTHAEISEIRYKKAELSSIGEKFELKPLWLPIAEPDHPSYRDIFELFSIRKYLFPRHPIDLGKIDIEPIQKCLNVLRTIIKWENSEEIRVPKELSPVVPLLKKILQYEKWINKDFKKFFIHLTIDNSQVEKGKHHRFPGYHGDGFQGAKFPNKLVCEHSYIVVSDPGTDICLQPFFLEHLNEARHNVFTEFDKQARKDNIYQSIPNHLYLFDPYIVHQSPVIDENKFRTFFRLTITPAELLIPKNTINPMFVNQSYPERLDIREYLAKDCDIDIPYRMYGLEKKL